MTRRAASVQLLALPLLQACTLHPVDDLHVIAVARLPAAALPDDPATESLRAAMISRGEAVWKVKLEGGAEWARTVRRHEMNGYALASRCDRPDFGLFELGPYVGRVKIAYGDPAFERFDPGQQRQLRYDVYIAETGRYTSLADFNAKMPAYDLARERVVVCVTLGGGAMTGIGARSNEVRATIGGGR